LSGWGALTPDRPGWPRPPGLRGQAGGHFFRTAPVGGEAAHMGRLRLVGALAALTCWGLVPWVPSMHQGMLGLLPTGVRPGSRGSAGVDPRACNGPGRAALKPLLWPCNFPSKAARDRPIGWVHAWAGLDPLLSRAPSGARLVGGGQQGPTPKPFLQGL